MAQIQTFEYEGGTVQLIDDGVLERLVIDTPNFKYDKAIAHEIYKMTKEERYAIAEANLKRTFNF